MFPDFLATERILPLFDLVGGDQGEEVLRGAELVAGLDSINDPGVGDERLGLNAELLKNGGGGVGEVGGDQGGEEVDLVQSKTDNCGAAVGLLGKQLVVELVVLEQLVAETVVG